MNEPRRSPAHDSRGGALLTVLWLSAGLAAIAFAVATTVRGEVERAATLSDTVRAQYLAAGAIDRALLYMEWGPRFRRPDGSSLYYEPWMNRLPLNFPGGEAVVEVIPATARLNINTASEADLFRLLLSLGAEPERARETARGIIDWRTPAPGGGPTPFDLYYLSLVPSFRARHASFEEVEEVLLIKGMTPGLFYGTYHRDPQGRLHPGDGFRDCVSVYGVNDAFDVNSAPAALLASIGLPPEAVARILEIRRLAPFRSPQQLDQIRQFMGPAGSRLRIGGHTMYTLRATARLRLQDGALSDLRRSVAATVKMLPPGSSAPYVVLRWYDHAPPREDPWL